MAGRRLAAGLAAAVLLLAGADGGCGSEPASPRCPALRQQHDAAYAAMHKAPTGSAAYKRARARYLDLGRQMRQAQC